MTNFSSILAFSKKLFSLETSGFMLLAAPGSVSLAELLNALIEDTPAKELMLPLVVSAVGLSMYFVVFALDFISGVKASRHEAEDKADFFSSAKGWSSIWKISTVFILVIWSSFFAMLSAIADLDYLSDFFMLSAGGIAIMATLLDIYSIGENQKRLTGKKADFFDWLEEIMKLVEQGVVLRFLQRHGTSETLAPAGEKRTEGRGQRAEGRGERTEGRGQRAEDRGQRREKREET